MRFPSAFGSRRAPPGTSRPDQPVLDEVPLLRGGSCGKRRRAGRRRPPSRGEAPPFPTCGSPAPPTRPRPGVPRGLPPRRPRTRASHAVEGAGGCRPATSSGVGDRRQRHGGRDDRGHAPGAGAKPGGIRHGAKDDRSSGRADPPWHRSPTSSTASPGTRTGSPDRRRGRASAQRRTACLPRIRSMQPVRRRQSARHGRGSPAAAARSSVRVKHELITPAARHGLPGHGQLIGSLEEPKVEGKRLENLEIHRHRRAPRPRFRRSRRAHGRTAGACSSSTPSASPPRAGCFPSSAAGAASPSRPLADQRPAHRGEVVFPRTSGPSAENGRAKRSEQPPSACGVTDPSTGIPPDPNTEKLPFNRSPHGAAGRRRSAPSRSSCR